jgi:hypothetical protein
MNREIAVQLERIARELELANLIAVCAMLPDSDPRKARLRDEIERMAGLL